MFTTSCDRVPRDGTAAVTIIGAAPRLAPAGLGPLDAPSRVLDGAVAQGLVRFDAAGQIEPGVAERWIVIDDGLTYIFRLREATWPDGQPVTSTEVAAAFRRQLAPESRNPLAPFLSAVESVVAMTPEVVEVHLARPRPDLLRLFAQPELAILREHPPVGSGPFRMSPDRGAIRLRAAVDPTLADEDTPRAGTPTVRLDTARAALAIARFRAGMTDVVTGGGFTDWPLLATADVPRASIRVDPAAGLFGLAFANRDGFLADSANRGAVAGAFDRPALGRSFGATWTPAEQMLPDTLDSAALPAQPDWVQLSLTDRRAAAATRVAAWQGDHPGPLVLRVALPAGPGATILWGEIAATLMAIGATPERVPPEARAELRLVDAVAPFDSARWYLATACQPCGPDAAAALEAARLAPDMAARAQAIAAADLAVAADAPFVILARPPRWSLVAARLDQWQTNARAWHPLNHLLTPTR